MKCAKMKDLCVMVIFRNDGMRLPLRVVGHQLDDLGDFSLVDEHHATGGGNSIVFKRVLGLCNRWWRRQLEVLCKLGKLLQHFFLWVEKECRRLRLFQRSQEIYVW